MSNNKNYKEYDIEFLSPQELINIFRRRKHRADIVLSQIILHASESEKYARENEKLISIINACQWLLMHPEEVDVKQRQTLMDRINNALLEHDQ